MGAKKTAGWVAAVILFAAAGWHLMPSRGSSSSSEISLPMRGERAMSPIAGPQAKSGNGLLLSAPKDGGHAEVAASLGVASAPLQPDAEKSAETLGAALLQTERAFDAEQADPLWSQAMETRILSEIAEIPGLEALTVQAQCRTSMCRVELRERGQLEPGRILPANAAFGRLVLALDHQPLWIMSLVDPYGTPTSLAYLARDHLDASVGNAQ